MPMRQRLRLVTSAPPEAGRSAEEERSRLADTLDQLERAELYVVAALGLQSADRDRRRAIEDLRAGIVALRRALVRPGLAG